MKLAKQSVTYLRLKMPQLLLQQCKPIRVAYAVKTTEPIMFALSSYQCSTLNQTSAFSALVTVSLAGGGSLLVFFVSEPLLTEALRLGGILCRFVRRQQLYGPRKTRLLLAKCLHKEDETVYLCLIRSVYFGRLYVK